MAACQAAPADPPASATGVQPVPATGTPAPPTAAAATATLAPPTPTEEEAFALLPPDPLYVSPVLDAARAVTGVIPARGGSLSALAADGSEFILSVPAGALLSDQQIVMTPLLDVEGQTLSGGFAAGVHLAPSGLQLQRAASLTIVPASPVPVEMELSFAIHGPDNEALLFPLVPTTEAATFLITHFSGYYVAEGDEDDLAAQLARIPTLSGDQMLQQLQSLLRARREAELGGGAEVPGFDAKVGALVRAYWNKVLAPNIALAKTSDDWRFVCRVIADVIGYQRMLEMLGGAAESEATPGPGAGGGEAEQAAFDLDATLNPLLARQAELLKAHAEALCSGGYRLLGWLYVLRIARTQLVRQADYGVSLADWSGRCPPPTLEFSSRVTRTMLWQYDGVSRVITDVDALAEMPLRFDSGKWAFVGEGPLTLMVLDANSIAGVSGHGGNRYCSVNWAPAGSTLTVETLTVNLNSTECEEKRAPDADAGIELVFDPGLPNENWSQDCSAINSGGITLDNNTYFVLFQPWIDLFRLYHREQLEDGKPELVEGQGYVFRGPSKIKFAEWRLAPDAASAQAMIEQFRQVPTCPTCTYLDAVEDTQIKLR